MEHFASTLGALKEEDSQKIGRQMAMEAASAKSKIDLGRFDWERVQYADPRDPRAVRGPCKGHHQLAGFGRGSPSGSNGHALWLTCRACQLRVMYVPTWGSKGTFRSPGPLIKDVEEKLQTTPENELHPEQLSTQALGLDAAEMSALRKLEKIKTEKATLQHRKGKGKGKMEGDATPSTVASSGVKKTQKRDHLLTPEQQEVHMADLSSEKEWQEVP